MEEINQSIKRWRKREEKKKKQKKEKRIVLRQFEKFKKFKREMRCSQYFHNIFIINFKWQVVTGCYYWSKKVILVLGSNLNQ